MNLMQTEREQLEKINTHSTIYTKDKIEAMPTMVRTSITKSHKQNMENYKAPPWLEGAARSTFKSTSDITGLQQSKQTRTANKHIPEYTTAKSINLSVSLIIYFTPGLLQLLWEGIKNSFLERTDFFFFWGGGGWDYDYMNLDGRILTDGIQVLIHNTVYVVTFWQVFGCQSRKKISRSFRADKSSS